MKRIAFLISLCLGLSTIIAQAALVDRGGGMIYDTDLNITWYDAAPANMTWDQAVVRAANLSIGGFRDWRLPSSLNHDGSGLCDGYNCNKSEMGHLFYLELRNKGYIAPDGTGPQAGWGLNNKGPFVNLQSSDYWAGGESGTNAVSFGFNNGSQHAGTKTASIYAMAVRLGDVVPHLSAGLWHTAALKPDGTLWIWGRNNYGQLGDETNIDKSHPIQMGTDNNWAAVSVGYGHTVAIKKDGSLWAWGFNESGQLGDGTNINKNTPVKIGTDNDWVAIAAGEPFTLALKKNGSLWGWGNNDYGQLGDGGTLGRNVPARIGTEGNWASITAGEFHSVALKSDGTLWAWGNNALGQLGDGSNTNRYNPTQIGTQNDWIAISTKYHHTMAIRADGSLWGWGQNNLGQLGDGTLTLRNYPVRIGTENNWRSVVAAGGHTLALKKEGTLWAWGLNDQGQVGANDLTNRNIPTKIGSETTWNEIAAGRDHSLAIKSDGTFWAWGVNNVYQLGTGTNTRSTYPVQIVVRKYLLSLTKSGNGSGTVTSNLENINCGVNCSASYNYGTQITLTAVSSSGSFFSGWSGDCSGTDACTLTINGDKAVTGTFTSTSLTGSITTDVVGKNVGIINADISLLGTPLSTKTDSNGNFLLSNIPAGNYTLIISAPNFIPISQQVNVAGGAMQITIPPLKTYKPGDATGDGKLGLEDAIYILQITSGMRPQ